MQYRHELKYIINPSDVLTLRMRLSAVATPDTNSVDGKYSIRSLYFDDAKDSALLDNISGAAHRAKYRIRYYNGNTEHIHFEKKCKDCSLGYKLHENSNASAVEKILAGDYSFLLDGNSALFKDFYRDLTTKGLVPKVIVDYEREPYVFPAGNVRVTIDSNIRSSHIISDFLNPGSHTVPVDKEPIILEVKWDEYLPDIIKDAVRINGRPLTGFSKYAMCRSYE